MKKKILAISIVVCLAAVAIIGGTLAYFTDKADVTNTFTVGSVKINLLESQYSRTNGGKGYTTDPEPQIGGYIWAANVDLQGDSTNTPDVVNAQLTAGTAFFSDEQIKNDAKTYKTAYFNAKATNIVPGRNIRKNPYVENVGNNDAYIRVRVLVPCDLYNLLELEPLGCIQEPMNNGLITSNAMTYYMNNNGTLSDTFKENRSGKEYYRFDFTYTEKLAPNAVTFWNAWSNIALKKSVTAADLASITEFNVIFEADAIQADGFTNGQEAFVAFDAA